MGNRSEEIRKLMEELAAFGQGPCKCFYCEERFACEDVRAQHLAEVHPNRDNTKYTPRCLEVKCTFCDLTFSTDQNRNIHIHKDHFDCSICYVDCKTPTEREKHMVKYHSINCPYCEAILLTNQDKLDHINLSHRIRCNMCKFEARSEDEKVLHMINDHFICIFCKEEHSSADNREMHIQRLHTFECKVCFKVFNVKRLLEEHSERKHSFKCEVCSDSFTTADGRNKHMMECHSFNCNFCDFVYRTNELKLAHILNQHHFQCRYCQEVHFNEQDSARHILEFHSSTCILCHAELETEELRRCHIADDHQFRCATPQCNSVLSTIEKRDTHIEIMHYDPCSSVTSCSTSYTEKSGIYHEPDYILSSDEIAHASSLFKCDGCDIVFGTFELRQLHIINEHYLKCPSCKNMFSSEKSIDEHVEVCRERLNRLHIQSEKSPTRLWKCNDCNRSWPSEGELYIHSQLVHVIPEAEAASKKLQKIRKGLD